MKTQVTQSAPGFLALVGLFLLFTPLTFDSLYANFYVATGAIVLFVSWVIANFVKKERLIAEGKWSQQAKAMIGMTLCLSLGLAMLLYYEKQIPKYNVAFIKKELYRVPPQLNKKELIALGAECNLEGNTLCSQAVFAKIVKMDPRNFQALANLAIAQSHLGFHQQALFNFKTAIKNGAGNFDTYHFYGNSLLALNNKKEAIKAYRISLEKNPQQFALRKKLSQMSQK